MSVARGMLKHGAQSTLRRLGKKPEVARIPDYVSYQDVKFPGSRILYLTKADSETPAALTAPLFDSMTERLNLYAANPIVDLVAVSSRTPGTFCTGIDPTLSNKEAHEIIDKERKFCAVWHNYGPIGAVSIDGEVVDGGLIPFLNAKYRLGSSKTSLRVSALKTHGRVPVGGVAYSLVQGDLHRVGMARLLGLTGYRMNVIDMLEWGLVSHLTQPEAFQQLLANVAQIPLRGDARKATQAQQLHRGALANVLTGFLLGEDAALARAARSPLWDKFLGDKDPDMGSRTPGLHKMNEDAAEKLLTKESLETASESSDVTAESHDSRSIASESEATDPHADYAEEDYYEYSDEEEEEEEEERSRIELPPTVKSWADVKELEQYSPDLFKEAYPLGVSVNFPGIEEFATDIFGVNNNLQTSKRLLEKFIESWEHRHRQMSHTSLSVRQDPTWLMSQERKIEAAKLCLETLNKTDTAVLEAWFDLTRTAASNDSLNSALQDELFLLK